MNREKIENNLPMGIMFALVSFIYFSSQVYLFDEQRILFNTIMACISIGLIGLGLGMTETNLKRRDKDLSFAKATIEEQMKVIVTRNKTIRELRKQKC